MRFWKDSTAGKRKAQKNATFGCKIFERSLVFRRPKMNASGGNKFLFTTSMRIKAFTVLPPMACAPRAIASARDRFAALIMILFLGGALVTIHAANESAPKGFQFVNLSTFADSFAEFADGKPVAALPKGTQTYGSVPFQIGSPIAVTGLEAARGGELFSKELTGI